MGFNSDVVEKALNHTIGGVRGVYNRAQYAPQRRVMLQRWADFVDAMRFDDRPASEAFAKVSDETMHGAMMAA